MSNDRGWAKRTGTVEATARAPEPEAGAAVDLAHLRRYTLGDAGLEREILNLFLAQMPITIALLRDATLDSDWKMASHSLKGSARAVGAWSLAAAAEQAEKLIGEGEDTRLAQVTVIEREAAEVRAFIGRAYAPSEMRAALEMPSRSD